MEILLVRHAQSTSNSGSVLRHFDDHSIALTEKGIAQATALTAHISRETVQSSLLYCSPYVRARDTPSHLLAVHDLTGLTYREDPLLREIEGSGKSERRHVLLARTNGSYFYRYPNGESPADVNHRMTVFKITMHRDIERTGIKKILIVSHSSAIRCFIRNFLQLSIGDFERMRNPKNCAVIRIGPVEAIADPCFIGSRWAVSGLSVRPIAPSAV